MRNCTFSPLTLSGIIDHTNRPSLLGGTLAVVNGSLIVNQPLQFIFPNTTLVKMSRPISEVVKPSVDLNSVKGEKAQFLTNGSYGSYIVNYKKMKFEKDSTPVAFRTYLTFRTGEKENRCVLFMIKKWTPHFWNI